MRVLSGSPAALRARSTGARAPTSHHLRCAQRFIAVRAQAAAEKQSLAQKLGGPPAVRAAVDVFYRRMMADDRVNYFFDGIDMKKQRGHQVAFLTFAMGGADKYEGNANMTTAHERLVRDLGMSMEHFDITLEHLGGALEELGVPQDQVAEAAATVDTLRPAFQEAVDKYDDNAPSAA